MVLHGLQCDPQICWVWLGGRSDQNSMNKFMHAHFNSWALMPCYSFWASLEAFWPSIPERKRTHERILKEKRSFPHIGFTFLEMGTHMLPVTKRRAFDHTQPDRRWIWYRFKIQLFCQSSFVGSARWYWALSTVAFWSDCKTVRLQCHDLRCTVREQQQSVVSCRSCCQLLSKQCPLKSRMLKFPSQNWKFHHETLEKWLQLSISHL